ncbi:MAG TPA: LacI family DNA-binding transcriptional regulator [Capsulimonadaceae bacterium]
MAERACVSAATVSYFASGREDKCSPETAARIREAIEHLRYTPNSLSRSLRTRQTMTIGISVGRSIHINSYGERLWSGIDLETDAAGYSQIYYPAVVRHGPSVDSYLDGRIDGLILAPSNPDDRPHQIAAANMPIVVLAPMESLQDGCGMVYVDEYQTVDLALTHLWNMGHRRIGHILGPVIPMDTNPYAGQPAMSALARRDGYIKWMGEHNAYDSELLVPALSWVSDDKSRAAIRTYLQRIMALPCPPTAFFCANDALALAVIEIAASMGFSVPHDLSVIGVDNSIDGVLSEPRLTTVSIPAKEVGSVAVRTLLRIIQDEPINECRVAIPVTDLIVRGSTRAL